MFTELDPEKNDESLKIAERLLNDSEDGKKTIELLKKKKKKLKLEVLCE